MTVEYEEKTYESYFNSELDSKSSIYFPFGQIQEGVIGLDSASYSRNRHLWRMLDYPFMFRPHYPGIDLKDVANEMQRYLGEVVKNIPSMVVNLLFQYKRPQYLNHKRCKEWHLWNKAYYRYDIYKKQQNLLDNIGRVFGEQALILYAAPAIETSGELIESKKKRTIIENSNFKKASELSGHDRNTYLTAGTYSIACSEPERINNINLIELLESQKMTHDLSNKEFVFKSNENTINALSENKKYYIAYESLMEEYEDIKDYRLLHCFISMKVFRDLTGIQWLVKTEP